MIPELGHFALILACRRARAGRAAADRRRARHSGRLDGAGAAGGAGAVPADRIAFGCLAQAFSPTTSRCSTSPSTPTPAADPVPHRRRLGRPRRLAAAVGADAGRLGLPPCRCSRASLPDDHGGARARRAGPGQHRLPALHPAHLQPLRAPAAGRRRGRDLNPLLQDPGLVFHPPMLYMGYVGFSVAFAFAIAALLSGRLDAAWARWSRPWTTAAWVFLTLGIAWAAGGPTTNWAGAAGGSGTRWRTPPSCPGWSARR
jgi:hypothetical protein